jgi:hypothetical protein
MAHPTSARITVMTGTGEWSRSMLGHLQVLKLAPVLLWGRVGKSWDESALHGKVDAIPANCA